MQHDFYAFQHVKMGNALIALEHAEEEREKAKKISDKKEKDAAVKIAEVKKKRAAIDSIGMEPNLAYLWLEAKASKLSNYLRDSWQESFVVNTIPDGFSFTPAFSGISQMPLFSFMIQFSFRLYKSYISKDECEFYLLDNPIRKEKVFQTPMVASTSWKGSLRAALWQLGYNEDNEIISRLFGNPHDAEKGLAGRLYFYPTFFDDIALDIINPHDRKTGSGGSCGPIPIECVPQGAIGCFSLIYVPFDRIGENEKGTIHEVAIDLELVIRGIQAMLTTYGFGAKTSSGFGTAEDRLAGKGRLALRAELPVISASPVSAMKANQTVICLPRYLESSTSLHADFRRPDGSLKSDDEYKAFIESQGKKYAKSDKQVYEKARKWWERERGKLGEEDNQAPVPELTVAPLQPPPITAMSFSTLTELCELSQQVALQLQAGGEA